MSRQFQNNTVYKTYQIFSDYFLDFYPLYLKHTSYVNILLNVTLKTKIELVFCTNIINPL